MITFTPKPQATVPDVCAEALLLARLNGDTVHFSHEGVNLDVSPGSGLFQVERAYFESKKKTEPTLPYRQPYAD